MINIFFCCSWDPDPAHFLNDKYKPLTLLSSGKWKNLNAVTDIKKAEWVIIIDAIHPKQLKDVLNFDKNKVICIPREPHRFNPNYLNYNFKYKYTYNNFYHCWTSIMCINKTYDELIAFNKYNKSKLCSTVTSGLHRNIGLYPNRIDFIKKLSKQPQFIDKIDIFGYNWDANELGTMYKGTLEGVNPGTCNKMDKLIHKSSKWDGLEKYKYSIAIENSYKKNYFTEKFTDCILAKTIPIYYGCPNISDFFPKDCYYWLDINSPDCFTKLEEILNSPITDKQIKSMEIARKLILEKYNVWEVVYNIIKND